jgi:hypothetical protein
MKLNTVEELLEDIRQGKMIILMDDEDRENEGDLVMAAPMVRPQDINFMATNARGLISCGRTIGAAITRSPSFSRSSSSIKRTILPFLISEISSSVLFSPISVFFLKLFF